MKALALLVCAAVGLVVAGGACNEGEVANAGLGEPLQVAKGQFIPGSLPPTTVTNPPAGPDAGPGRLVVTQAFIPTVPAFVPGSSQIMVSGRATSDAVAVAVHFADLGTGYWVVPMGVPDPLNPGENGFSMNVSLNPSDPPGSHNLLFEALDGSGNAGSPLATPLCIDTKIPDNKHACIPSNTLPSAVFSLAWDANFDLDLHVITPDGSDLNPKTEPVLAGADAGPAMTSCLAPRFDHDSLVNCMPDGFRQEDLYWNPSDIAFQSCTAMGCQCPPTSPPPAPNVPVHGTYLVYVNPFAPCGQPAVRFTFTLYLLKGTCPDCQLVAQPPVSGELLASQVTGGSSPPTYVTKYSL